MKIKLIKIPNDTDWLNVKDSALTTMGLSIKNRPDSKWKLMILKSEHSPIRDLWFSWKWIDLKSWISVHLVRHSVGATPFVFSQRPDRMKGATEEYDRDKAPQGALVTHKESMNAQAIINASRKRLCYLASKETHEAWQEFVDSLKDYEPELYQLCVPNCIYRNGMCGEPKSCGYNKTEEFKKQSKKYNKLFENKGE